MKPDAMIAGSWALVPVKDPGAAKTRLSGVLSGPERTALQRAMLHDVLVALSQARQLAGIAVIGGDHEIAAAARRQGARIIDEPAPGGGLNAAIEAGVEHLCRSGARIVAVIPADLPLADPVEIDRAVTAAIDHRITVLVPDQRRQGTNALIFHTEAMPRFAFGEDSFRKHATASDNATPVLVLPLASLAFDIDLPADLTELAALRQRIAGGHTARLLSCLAPRFCRIETTEEKA